MNNYNRDRRPGGRRDFGGRDSGNRGFGNRNRGGGQREMFSAVCSNCGKTCQVPFRPTGEKPVYCSDCFEKMGNRELGRRPEFQSRNEPKQQVSFDMGETNRKLDKIIEILSKMPSLGYVNNQPRKAKKTPVEQVQLVEKAADKKPEAKKTSKKKTSIKKV